MNDRLRKFLFIVAAGILIAMGVALHYRSAQRHASTGEKGEVQLTFSNDIAPIIFENCASCHRPGESAPFSLLTFADVC